MSNCLVCSLEVPPTSAYCPRCGTPNPEAPTVPTPTGGGGTTEHMPPSEVRQRLQAALGHDYVVGQPLGEGGFAVVFSVEDRRLSRRIAVKVLRPELTISRSTVQRFVREAESAARLNHPHILPIFSVGQGEGLVYFSMPLVAGETLEALIAHEPRLPEPEVTRIGAEVAEALAEAHADGLVHRDIKPANILLQGPKRRVLVADFGIAKAAASKGDKLTGTGVVIGSPHYMSPEQAGGSGEVDHRSDIYSLGLVLWQMLTGELPFDGPDSQSILVQQLTKPIPPLRTKRRDVNSALAAIVEHACAKRPEDRYQSTAELAEALRALGAAGSTGQPPAGRRTQVLVVALAASVVIGASAFVVVKLRAPHRPSTTADIASAGVARSSSAAPMLAVLPFVVTFPGDTAQIARQSAGIVASTISSRFEVPTVDFNELVGQWTAQGRTRAALPDSNAAFAYRLAANQVVLGSIFAPGPQARVSADVYDTRSLSKIGHAQLDGDRDSLTSLLDSLAGLIAVTLCRQPDFNPRNLCFDRGAQPSSPISVALPLRSDSSLGGSHGQRTEFYVLIGPGGELNDLQPKGDVPADVFTAALPALQSATYSAAMKQGVAVERWTTVTINSASTPLTRVERDPRCDTSDFGIRNEGHACWDIRPVPRSELTLLSPPECRSQPAPSYVAVQVSAEGNAVSATPFTRNSRCPAFDAAATAYALGIQYRPATKSGTAAGAWIVIPIIPRAR